MTPIRYDLEFRQGATFRRAFLYVSGGVPVSLAGFEARMQIRDRVGGRVLADLSSANGALQVEAAAGRVDVEISETVSTNLPDRGTYDLFVFSADDSICLAEGDVLAARSVTKVRP